jgi:hypothetical protein
MANFDEDREPCGKNSYNLRDLEYGVDGGVSVLADKVSEEETGYGMVTEDERKAMITTVVEQAEEGIKDVVKDIGDNKDMSKEEKKLLKRFFIKKITKMKEKFTKQVKEEEYDLADIETEFDETLSKLRDTLTDLMEDDNYYGYDTSSWKSDYTQSKLNTDYKNDRWPKKDYSRVSSSSTTEGNDYSKDLKEVKSDKRIKMKLDIDSLNSFLAESDGKKENIAVITADNREYKDLEKTIFKVVLVPNDVKLRQGAYTEADGKKIADALASVNTVKCGWIHTHPFGEHSTFFSSRDDDTTKEMCVLPDDYCIALVVGCAYNEGKHYMTPEGKIIKEYELKYALGRLMYRKAEIPKNEYDPKTDKIKQVPELMLVKYDLDVTLVDKDGKEVSNIHQIPVNHPETYSQPSTAVTTTTYANSNTEYFE